MADARDYTQIYQLVIIGIVVVRQEIAYDSLGHNDHFVICVTQKGDGIVQHPCLVDNRQVNMVRNVANWPETVSYQILLIGHYAPFKLSSEHLYAMGYLFKRWAWLASDKISSSPNEILHLLHGDLLRVLVVVIYHRI